MACSHIQIHLIFEVWVLCTSGKHLPPESYLIVKFMRNKPPGKGKYRSTDVTKLEMKRGYLLLRNSEEVSLYIVGTFKNKKPKL